MLLSALIAGFNPPTVYPTSPQSVFTRPLPFYTDPGLAELPHDTVLLDIESRGSETLEGFDSTHISLGGQSQETSRS